jgi:hypothetical protein
LKTGLRCGARHGLPAIATTKPRPARRRRGLVGAAVVETTASGSTSPLIIEFPDLARP